jgi:holo-[acyl-carrier protein] synthase
VGLVQIGLGCDVLEVARVEGLVQRAGEAFVRRVLTPLEHTEYTRRSVLMAERGLRYLCTRFAAKEAFSKALGTGIGHAVAFQDVAVLNEPCGQPALHYYHDLQSWMVEHGLAARVSLSDERTVVMATVFVHSAQWQVVDKKI